MIREMGQVSMVDDRGVWVKTIRQSTCNACQAKNGCGQRLLNQIGASTNAIWAEFGAEFSAEVAVGDWVEIGVEEGAVVLGSLLAYGLPVLLLVLGAAIGQGSTWSAVFGALLGLGSGALLSRHLLRAHIGAQFFQPTVIALVQPEQRVNLLTL